MAVPCSVKPNHHRKHGPGEASGRPASSQPVSIKLLSNRLPHPLAGESEEDRDQFAGAIFRPPKYLDARARDSPELESYKWDERRRIKGLPAGMLQPKPRPPGGAGSGPCKVHRAVDQKLLKALFMKVQNEALGRHVNALVPLRDEKAQNLVRDLQDLTAYWVRGGDFAKLYMTEPPVGGWHRFQDSDCNGCILAAIGGDLVALEALRISALARTSEGGRLVAWLDSWIKLHGTEALAQIKERSARIGEAIRGLRRTSYVCREKKFRKEQRARNRSWKSEFWGGASREQRRKEEREYCRRLERQRPTPHLCSTIRRATSPRIHERFHGQFPKRTLVQELQEANQPIIRPCRPRGGSPEPPLSASQNGNRQQRPNTNSVQHRGSHRKAERPIGSVSSEYTALPETTTSPGLHERFHGRFPKRTPVQELQEAYQPIVRPCRPRGVSPGPPLSASQNGNRQLRPNTNSAQHRSSHRKVERPIGSISSEHADLPEATTSPGLHERFRGQFPKRTLVQELQEPYQPIIRPAGPWAGSSLEPPLSAGQDGNRQRRPNAGSVRHRGSHRKAEGPISSVGLGYTDLPETTTSPGLHERFHGQLPRRPLVQELQEPYQPIIRPARPWGGSSPEAPLSAGQNGNGQRRPNAGSVRHRGSHRKAGGPVSSASSGYTDLRPEDGELERISPSLSIFWGTSAPGPETLSSRDLPPQKSQKPKAGFVPAFFF